MINTDEFSKRLQKVIDYYDESASSFAEKIGVQRSSISHILSGRNKPSLDFVMKILHAYPDVNLYWIINGKGEFPSLKVISQSETQNLFNNTPEPSVVNKEKSSVTGSALGTSYVSKTDSDIEAIVIFYKDGSFKHYKP